MNERERTRTESSRRNSDVGDGFRSTDAPDPVAESPGSDAAPGQGANGGGVVRKRGVAGPGKIVAGIAVAVMLAAAAFFTLSPGVSDDLSQQDIDSRAEQYRSLTAMSGGLPLAFVDAADVDRAIAELPESVSQEQRVELRSDVDAGRVNLAWLSLWDTHSEDGDVLRFESANSFPIEVTALNAKTTIAIPYPADGNVVVTGVRDGGGGITIALESGATQIAWPSMAPGDTLDLPVSPGR